MTSFPTRQATQDSSSQPKALAGSGALELLQEVKLRRERTALMCQTLGWVAHSKKRLVVQGSLKGIENNDVKMYGRREETGCGGCGMTGGLKTTAGGSLVLNG